MNAREQFIAFMTILVKEIRRYTRIWTQTLLPSAITMSLYFVIFGSLIGSRIGEMGGFTYMQFVVPGLIDCFAALNHQAQANAYLALGVTTIVGVESTRRGPLDRDSDPSPDIRLLGEVGYEALPLPELLAAVEAEHARGVDVLADLLGR